MIKGKQKLTAQQVSLSQSQRIFMLILYILQYVAFACFNILVAHYTILPLPFLFSAPSLSASPYTKPSYLYNTSLYSLFFVQHISMAMIKFKLVSKNMYNKYPLFERYIYNITSVLTYNSIIYLSKPVSQPQNVLFTTPLVINLCILIPSLTILLMCIYNLRGSLFGPYTPVQILNRKSLKLPNYIIKQQDGLIKTGLYAYCRHPLSGSTLVLFVFASNVYTVDRIIFIFVNILGIVIGTYYQQKKVRQKFTGYTKYEQQVKYKLIPYIY